MSTLVLRHRRPCAECPWRRVSLQGFLGGNDAYVYADSVAMNLAPPCHLNDAAFCVGALTTANNMCLQLSRTPGAVEAQLSIPQRRSSDFFAHVSEFYEYHAEQPYVSRWERAASGELTP